MRKGIAIARAISPLSRPRVVFWLFLALLLTLAALTQLGHAIKTSAAGFDAGYTLMSADDPWGQDCLSHGGAVPGSHCCSVSGCVVAAIASTPAVASPLDLVTAQVIAGDAAAPGRTPSPFFHPPKLVVQA